MEKGNVIINNLFWRFFERIGAKGVSFVVSIILARLLEPKYYGTIALITVFTTILQVFIDSGMGNALIQKKDADDLDFSSVFYFNVAMCSVLYIIMFFAAPFIADFYNDATLTPVIRVLCLTIVISGVKNIQQAYVSRNLMFKKFFFATLGGTVGAAVIGIVMAYLGYGVWALVVQGLFNSIVDTLILWITVKWRPKLMFSLKRLKGLFSYGWKLLVSSLIDTVYGEIRQLIIGKMYTPEKLALYNKGKQLPQYVVTNINTSISNVLVPVMSREQDSTDRVRELTRKSMKISTYIMSPLLIGLAFTAEPVVRLLLTEKWIGCVPFLRIFCISFLFMPIHTANLSAIKALGRSDLFLKLEIIKKIVGMIALLISMWFGVMAMAYSLLFTNVVSQLINSMPNKKLLNYNYLQQIKDIVPNILIGVVMGLCIYPVEYLKINTILILAIQFVLGAIIFIALSKIFKFESYGYLIDIIKSYRNKKRKKEC